MLGLVNNNQTTNNSRGGPLTETLSEYRPTELAIKKCKEFIFLIDLLYFQLHVCH